MARIGVAMSAGDNPYGDGKAAERILEAITRWHQGKTPLLEPEKEFKLPPRPPLRRRKSDTLEGASSARPEKVRS